MKVVRKPSSKLAIDLKFKCKKCEAEWRANPEEAIMTIGYRIRGYSWYLSDKATYTMRCPFCRTRNITLDKGYTIIAGEKVCENDAGKDN